jgi:ribonuclease P protein component
MIQEKNFKLTRNERLSGRKRIEHLYANGKSFHLPSIRVMWILNTEEEILSLSQVMFSAPKKKFKKAVTRNRLKRLMRESYRKNKHLLYDFLEEKNKNIHLSIVFTGSADISYAETEGKIILTLQRLIEEIKLSLAK